MPNGSLPGALSIKRGGRRGEAGKARETRPRRERGPSVGRCGYLLGSALVCTLVLMVDAAKVGYNDWHWQGNDQNTTE